MTRRRPKLPRQIETVGCEEAVIDWIERNQLGRRNLSADARKLILGRRYNRIKKAATDNLKKGKESPKDQNDTSGTTASKLAAENHVSPATVKRAGAFAAEVDKNPATVKRRKRKKHPAKK